MRIHINVINLLIALATMISTASVFAADGQLEINQACVVNTGCFSGDDPGYPVTIDGSAGRSYRLTGDLIVLRATTGGIIISTPDVSIDLGGFTIIGLACVGTLNNCDLFSGSGTGVEVTSFKIRGVSVKNGSIVGMGANGVSLGDQAEVSDLRVRWNRLAGIVVFGGATVSGNTVYQNGGDGLNTRSGATISGNTVYENGNNGITTWVGATVSGNTVYQNGHNGIFVGTGSAVTGNTVNRNEHWGIAASNGSTVSGNTVRENDQNGLQLGADAAYRENVITFNGGTVSGGVNRGDNYCNGPGVISSSCP